MKKFNLRQIAQKIKEDVLAMEHKIEALVGSAEHKVTMLMDDFSDLVKKAENFAPILAHDLQNPIVKSIASFFGATSYVNGVVAILNRVGPKLKQLESDATLFNGALHHIAAEILVHVKDGTLTVSEAVDQIQKLFVPVDPSKILPSGETMTS